MPHITPRNVEDVPDDVRERLDAGKARSGYYSQAQLTLAHRPEVMKAVQDLQRAVGGSATVPMQTMFMVAELVAKVAGCRHCQSHAAHNLSKEGVDADKIRAIWEYEQSDLFDDKERAALDLAFAAAQVPSQTTAAHFDRLREAGYEEAELVDLMGMISLFGFLTRWNDGVATETEDSPAAFALEVLGSLGWERGAEAAAITSDASDGLSDSFRSWQDDGTSEEVNLSGTHGGALGINHMVMNVRDMDASHDFWTRVMRMEHCGTQGGEGQGRFLRFYRSNDATHHDIALTPVANPEDHPVPEGLPSAPGLNHFAWTYRDLDAWKEQVRHVVATGYPIQFRMEHGMSQSLYVRDPDGIVVEMMYEYPEEQWNANIGEALKYRRVLDIDDDADYFDPKPEDMPSFDEHGLIQTDH